MSGLEDHLSLDIAEALAAVSQIEQAFVSAGQEFQKALDDAIGVLNVADVTVPVEVDTSSVTTSVDDALNAADTQLDLFANTETIAPAIDDAIATADPTVDVKADVSEAQDAIDSLSADEVDVPVVADTTQAQEDISGLTDATHGAGDAAHGAGEEFALLGVGAKLAAGETQALQEALHLTGAQGATAAAGVAAVAVVGKELFSNALNARSAQERFNLVLGEFGESVEHIDIGGLNEDLQNLGVRLGTAAPSMENAAAKIFALGTNSGTAAPQVAETTKEIIALSARAVALNPALGDVGAVAERALSGLARGGRFAANLSLSLTAAEISARALADTGKTVAADLTLYEKAAAGAEIATEKLGGSLSTSINAGAENIKTQFAAIKARFEEALETLGQPLLDPILKSATEIQPVLISLAGVFADLLTPIADIASQIAGGLTPAIAALEPVASLLGFALQQVAGFLELIPGPVKAAVIAFVALNAVTEALAASQIVSGIARLTFGVTNLGAAAGPAAVALAGIGTVIAVLESNIRNTDAAVEDFLGGFQNTANAAQTFDELQASIDRTREAADKESDAAKKSADSLTAIFHTGATRGFRDAALGLSSVADAQQQVLDTAKQLEVQFHLTDVAALNLARGGQASIDAFEKQADAADDLSGTQLQAAHATEEFWLAAQSGALTSQDIAARAAETGAKFEDLAKSVEEARKPIVDFADSIINSLPGAAKALNDLGNNEGLHKFLSNFEQDLADSAAFIGNLQTLIDRGGTALADQFASLAKVDPTKAARLAKEAVHESIAAFTSDEAKAEALAAGQNLRDLAAQNVADELGGGLELKFQKTQDAIGSALLKIPGQVEPDANKSATQIAGIFTDAIFGGAALGALPDSAFNIGKETAVGLAAGMQGNESEVVFAAVQMAASVTNTVKKSLGVSSPSTVFADIGKDVVAGFFQGIADVKGTADAISPLLDVVDKFKLNANDIANAAGTSIDQITKSLEDLGKAQEKLTPDQLLKVGDAVKALGGSKGVKDLQNALAQQVSAAFGGLGGKEVADIVRQLNTAAAVNRGIDIFGVTPNIPKPFETTVVKGADSSATNPIIQQSITVTPPPDASIQETAAAMSVASAWALQSVVG